MMNCGNLIDSAVDKNKRDVRFGISSLAIDIAVILIYILYIIVAFSSPHTLTRAEKHFTCANKVITVYLQDNLSVISTYSQHLLLHDSQCIIPFRV
jgi:hypothetical protein